jgi:hypothetical protein
MDDRTRSTLSTTNQWRSGSPFFSLEYRSFAVEGFGDSLECVRYGRMPRAKLKEWKSKIFMRAPTERSAGALEGSGVASRDCETNGELISAGRKGTDRQDPLVAARVAAPSWMS